MAQSYRKKNSQNCQEGVSFRPPSRNPCCHPGSVFSWICLFLLGSGIWNPGSIFSAWFNNKLAGTSGAAFLKIGAGARPTAMGEAFTGVADDVNTVNWNAAGLAGLKKNEFVGMRAQLFQGLEYNFFAFAHPTKSWGTFGLSLNNLNINDIPARTGDSDLPDSTFSSNDTAYTAAYAKGISLAGDQDLKLGLGLKFIRQTLAGNTANSFGADLGALYEFKIPLTIGFSVQNVGTKPKFKNESDSLPLTIKLGGSYRIGQEWSVSGVQTGDEKTGLLLALDGDFPRDGDPSAAVGAEFTRRWREDIGSSIRAGYQTGRNRQIAGTGMGVSAGAGVTYKFFTFDFAWTPFGDLGDAFRYSIKLKF